MAEHLVKLPPAVTWKTEVVNNEHGYLAKEISKQIMKGAAWFVLLLIIRCERTEIS